MSDPSFSSLFMDVKKMSAIPDRLNVDEIVEEKLDGMRCLLQDNTLISKRGNRVSDAFPEIRAGMTVLPKDSIFDGELVIFQNGMCDFDRIQSRRNLQNNFKIRTMAGRFPATFMIFDVLRWKGESVINQSLLDRKKILQTLKGNGNFKVVLYYTDLEKIDRLNIEGIVIKNINEPYAGANGRWKKFRFEKERVVKIVKVEDHPAGCLLHSEEGWRINCGGEHNSNKARSLMVEGEFKVEIKYYEETANGELRFARFKRFVGDE